MLIARKIDAHYQHHNDFEEILPLLPKLKKKP